MFAVPKKISRITSALMVILFGTNMVLAPVSYAQVAFLPAAGTMVTLSSKFDPLVIKGVKLYPDNPFKFDFIVDQGDTHLNQNQIKEQGTRLISYFLASLTTPEKEVWVNLSPYEKQRIIPTAFGQTQMGQELLAQDYLLKQIMATALYPERELGKEFWAKVYAQAQTKFGTTSVPVSTFNKVWIVPDKAVVYENAQMNSVFIVESSLKVMLEKDYLAANKHKAMEQYGYSSSDLEKDTHGEEISSLSSNIIKQVVIPALEREVNTSKNFAQLRQVYNSLILAKWYKDNLKKNVLAQGYVDRDKIIGVAGQDKQMSEKIYKQYLKAYRKGVYNYIKEDVDPTTQQIIPRKYFSGGFAERGMIVETIHDSSRAMTAVRSGNLLSITAGFLLAFGIVSTATAGTHAITYNVNDQNKVQLSQGATPLGAVEHIIVHASGDKLTLKQAATPAANLLSKGDAKIGGVTLAQQGSDKEFQIGRTVEVNPQALTAAITKALEKYHAQPPATSAPTHNNLSAESNNQMMHVDYDNLEKRWTDTSSNVVPNGAKNLTAQIVSNINLMETSISAADHLKGMQLQDARDKELDLYRTTLDLISQIQMAQNDAVPTTGAAAPPPLTAQGNPIPQEQSQQGTAGAAPPEEVTHGNGGAPVTNHSTGLYPSHSIDRLVITTVPMSFGSAAQPFNKFVESVTFYPDGKGAGKLTIAFTKEGLEKYKNVDPDSHYGGIGTVTNYIFGDSISYIPAQFYTPGRFDSETRSIAATLFGKNKGEKIEGNSIDYEIPVAFERDLDGKPHEFLHLMFPAQTAPLTSATAPEVPNGMVQVSFPRYGKSGAAVAKQYGLDILDKTILGMDDLLRLRDGDAGDSVTLEIPYAKYLHYLHGWGDIAPDGVVVKGGPTKITVTPKGTNPVLTLPTSLLPPEGAVAAAGAVAVISTSNGETINLSDIDTNQDHSFVITNKAKKAAIVNFLNKFNSGITVDAGDQFLLSGPNAKIFFAQVPSEIINSIALVTNGNGKQTANNKAMAIPTGGIDLEKTNVQSQGSGVRTAFSDPAMLRMLLNADGLSAVIYDVKPATVPMMIMLLGLSHA